MELVNKKILIIETFPDTPLIETSCEIALNLKKKKVVFKNKSKYMNSGFYIISKKFKKFLKKGFNQLENEIIQNLIQKKRVEGKIIDANHIDIGTKNNLNYFKKFSKNLVLKKYS